MIDAKRLLSDLTDRLKKLEDDLRRRIGELPELRVALALQGEWQSARDSNRCAETFESWSEQLITQAGVHWLLSCVFLRFVKTTRLVERLVVGHARFQPTGAGTQSRRGLVSRPAAGYRPRLSACRTVKAATLPT
ncbi:MAG: hypothetical protein H6643_09015 [Caldilineaceae bacterium]|nr:hypothetical protein [Caldilineaceae bacterium]